MKLQVVTALILITVLEVKPIQLQQGETIEGNNVEGTNLNACLSEERGAALGVCFGKELLHKLNNYDEADSFSLASGVSFVRDEKTPRDISAFLDKDPMDFRSIMEDASNLISKRSLHWDMGMVYPGLVMRIGPTLANGVLDFVIDPRIKDRTYNAQGELSTGRLLARNLLVPFLLGIKFNISTLLPLLLGLLLVASKKAFLLAKVALLAVTLFSGAGYGGNYFGGLNNFGGPTISSYTHENVGHYQPGHSSGGYFHRHPHHADYFYKEKLDDHTTGSPITPDELRDRLERLFVTKKDDDELKIRNGRKFSWTPING
ncbi:uncharacterized protein LOC119837737 [Zerene cesonia]|uniref:uncharacterized protein LOC119837737 n=1 Tax=Zerene cesonia TaxID=33412 RepID=UPI0018E51AF6|nr:uncharacterized protein LOC119837737 [Zerene cesonia]